MDEITIRRAEKEDFPSIYDFINQLENETFGEESQREIFTGNISNPAHIYLVAALGAEIAGFLSCHVQRLLHHNGPVGEIQELYVRPENRNRGIGARLVGELKSLAASRGILQLEVTSNRKRKSAHTFYEGQYFHFTHKKFVCNVGPDQPVAE